MKTRAEHLAWCKEQALKLVDSGDVLGGITQMCCDLDKHPETKDHIGITMAMRLLMVGALDYAHDARRFIEGFR